MRISALDKRIVVLIRDEYTDKVGNRILNWENYCTCFANIEDKNRTEKYESAQVMPSQELVCTLRKCQKTLVITPENYRILIGNKYYEITNIAYGDRMDGFIKLTLKEALPDDGL